MLQAKGLCQLWLRSCTCNHGEPLHCVVFGWLPTWVVIWRAVAVTVYGSKFCILFRTVFFKYRESLTFGLETICGDWISCDLPPACPGG